MIKALEEPALVLNKGWSLVAVTTAADAMVKLYQDAAQIVHPDTYEVFNFEAWALRPVDAGKPIIHTPRLELQVPEVIVLTKYNEIPDHGLTYSRYHVFKRDKYVCQYCGHQTPRTSITVDHVVPKAQGGKTTWRNCVSSCEPCNALKADRTPTQAGMKLRKRPTKPTWSPAQLMRRYAEPKDAWSKFIPASK